MPEISGLTPPGLTQGQPYLSSSTKQMINLSINKANSIKKVYLKPKVARLYSSTSPMKNRTVTPS